ncbi:TIGR00252 family protein [Paenibacillaceae bacterium GAS479]|nr:TIGR00252 family protein [Paenibacillaceae bacterium GAS479]
MSVRDQGGEQAGRNMTGAGEWNREAERIDVLDRDKLGTGESNREPARSEAKHRGQQGRTGAGTRARGDQRIQSGRIAESAAAVWLEEQGYSLLQRNWRCRQGELDLIAEDNGMLVVVEVRSARAGSRFGTAAEAVNTRKQQKVRLVAAIYMQQMGWSSRSIRFDAAAITLDASGSKVEDILFIKDAF